MFSVATLDKAKAIRRSDLIAAAHDLVPRLRAEAAEADTLRRLPDRTVEALVAAGFHRIYQPARYGGGEMDYALQIELGYALGRGSASAAWVALFYATHPFVVGMMEPAAQDDVWQRTPDALIANAFFTPATTCRPVEGGFVLDGTWIISSGVTHADWNNLNVLVPRDGAAPEHRFMLVPRADYRILDDWRASGLAGTGSHSIVLDQVFVPEHRTLRTLDCRGGPTAGSRESESPLYRLPLMAVFPAGAAAPAPGIAPGALDHLVETLGGRANVAGARVADLPTVQVRLAEAAAGIDAALALLRADCAEIDRMARAGALPDMTQRARYRRDWGYAVTLSAGAVDALYPLLGAKGLDADHPAQRAWRDLHALAAHAALSWDIQAQHYGRALLGLPPTDPRI
jgi:3-hydroxy-9,10-secoandrosta-1,3,5(10)-triene-9,17-dione monooxygenase